MRYLIAIAIMIMSVALSAQIDMNVNTPEGSVSMSVTGVPAGQPGSGSVMDQIVVRLDKLEREFHSKLNKLDQKKAEKIMAEIYDLLGMLQDSQPVAAASSSASSSSSSSSSSAASGTANININISGMEEQQQQKPHLDKKPMHHEEHQEQSSRKVMPEGEFSTLISRINGESFGDDKLRVLSTAAKNYRFNVNQITRLIGAYTFSEDKIEALRISYPEVTDPQNNYKILDAFTFSDDKDAADDIINQ